jgi:hypothetical protein
MLDACGKSFQNRFERGKAVRTAAKQNAQLASGGLRCTPGQRRIAERDTFFCKVCSKTAGQLGFRSGGVDE